MHFSVDDVSSGSDFWSHGWSCSGDGGVFLKRRIYHE
jgi:hypothetical protein